LCVYFFPSKNKRFLTFPQTVATKESILKNLLELRLSVECAAIAMEHHADGHPHFHVALYLGEKLRLRDSHFFDSLCMKHGNYQTMKSAKGSWEYIHKEDPSPLVYGTPPTFGGSKLPKSTLFANAILSGASVDEVSTLDSGYFMLNAKKIQDFAVFSSMRNARLSLQLLVLPITYSGTDQGTQTVIDWLNTNLLCNRLFKAPQLYLSSPPNYLKTSLVIALEQRLRVFHMPLLEDFYDLYDDANYDLVVLDEFRGQKTIQFMNMWTQGGLMNVRKKGSQVMKTKNLPFIVLSNFPLLGAYKDATKIETLKTRFLEVELTEPLDLDNVSFNPVLNATK